MTVKDAAPFGYNRLVDYFKKYSAWSSIASVTGATGLLCTVLSASILNKPKCKEHAYRVT